MSYHYELARERSAELIRQADRQRLVTRALRARKERRKGRVDGSQPSAAHPARAGGASSVHLAA